jgi:hypothetical protein
LSRLLSVQNCTPGSTVADAPELAVCYAAGFLNGQRYCR